MATGPRIVHKQFNSPIGLYSQQNIKETLSKHMQNLDNGTVGIDFNNPATDKPANLANSAVLRMLEEEERNRRGYPKLDPSQVQAILDTLVHADHRFDSYWPPDRSKMRSARSWDGQLNMTGNIYSEFMKATKGQKKVVWPPVPETNGYHQPQQTQGSQPNYQQQYSPQPQSQYSPQAQSQYSPQAQSQYSPQAQSQQQYSPQPQYSPQQYSEPAYQPPQKVYEPPPATITLRQQPPIHQQPQPVYTSQPAAASFKGGVNMRGDQKWPPQSVREAVAAENEARRLLAKGPACRPRKVNKDYTSFFAQHALNHNYPGYRAPPGTQHYEDLSGRSSY
ncbi:LIM domain-binding protein 3 isoform X7 [Galleria mellonella]|uniref:LIM domain-binding protein 3 isoform X7 n=1 Tax=Galleria mellonella TaxID=7137 RepID=A0ABM3MDT0_GALME|nr:LIM domain-binding protein 3 isoform X7 [Galleria mellonella]